MLETSSLILNQTGAHVLAAAVCELFPGAQCISGQGGSKYFYFDFSFPFEFQENFLVLIEERMRLIIREKRSVRLMEMIPSNAASLMLHRGQKIAAEKLSSVQAALVQICQMGECVTVCPHALLEDLNIPFVKILEVVPIGKTLRIIGIASETKEELKRLAKEPPRSSLFHLKRAEEMQLVMPVEEGIWLWRPRGERICEQLRSWWRKEHGKQNFSLIATPSEGTEEDLEARHFDYFLRSQESKVAEIAWVSSSEPSDPAMGLLSPAASIVDRAHLFCSEREVLQECISSLHFILKIPKLLSFEFQVVLSVSSAGAQKMVTLLQKTLEEAGLKFVVEKTSQRQGASIEVRIPDSLGIGWTGPFLSVSEVKVPEGKTYKLSRSAFGSMERLLALLLEKTGGELPLWLMPEQVRILVISPKARLYAEEVMQTLGAQEVRATVESSEEKLKTRLYRAIVEKVPYIVLLGEREEKERALTVRASSGNEERKMTIEELCKKLKVEIGSGNTEFTH